MYQNRRANFFILIQEDYELKEMKKSRETEKKKMRKKSQEIANE